MTDGALRERLREETAALHARLHRHPGLCAAASGAIDIDGYRLLLMRLYGFHRAFETSMARFERVGPARSELLASDLETLGVGRERHDSLPLCRALALLQSDTEALGALYVVEGSALGGARIAQALRRSLLPSDGSGCRFFSNDGVPRRAWAEVLAQLKAIGDPREESAAISGALATFQAFDAWMNETGSAGTERATR